MATQQYGRIKRGNIVKAVALVVLGALFFVLSPILGVAAEYPKKPITITLGNPPGTGMCTTAQIFADFAKKHLPKPQPIVLNYKPGATQTVAAGFVLKQPAQGYNLFFGSGDLIGKLAKDPDAVSFTKNDFFFVGIIGTSPHVMTVNRKAPFTTFEEFLDYAKSNPGKLDFGSSGIGAYIHLNGEILQDLTGIKMEHIPFAGGAKARAALLGGHIDCVFGSIVTAGPQLGPDGGLRALVVFAPERLPHYPDIPTIFEKGYKMERGSIYYLAAPRACPQPVLDVLVKTFKGAADDPGLKAAIAKTGATPVNWGPEETEKRITDLFELNKKMMKKLGLIK